MWSRTPAPVRNLQVLLNSSRVPPFFISRDAQPGALKDMKWLAAVEAVILHYKADVVCLFLLIGFSFSLGWSLFSIWHPGGQLQWLKNYQNYSKNAIFCSKMLEKLNFLRVKQNIFLAYTSLTSSITCRQEHYILNNRVQLIWCVLSHV